MRKNFTVSFLVILVMVFLCLVSCPNVDPNVDSNEDPNKLNVNDTGCKVTFNSNYPSYNGIKEKEDESKIQYVIAEKNDYLNKNTFALPGYIFTGWKDSVSTVVYKDKAEVKFDSQRILDAQWEPIHYTIQFNNGDVPGSLESMINVAYNSTQTLNLPLEIVGYEFKYWSVNSTDETAKKISYDSTSKIYDHKAGHLSTVDGATVTLFASWDRLTISDGDIEIILPAPQTDITYNKTEQDLISVGSIKDKATGNEISYIYFEYSTDGGTSYSREIPKATNAGVYTICWRIVVDDNMSDYNPSNNSGSFEATIKQAPVTLTWTVGEYTYNAQEQGPTAEIASGVFSGDSVDVQISGQQINAGEHIEASATLTNSNYTIANPDQSYSIAKKKVTVTKEPTAVNNLIYNGNTQELVIAGSVSDSNGAKMQYSLTDGNYADGISAPKNAGTYTLYWKAVLKDSNNYELSGTTSGNIGVSIGKKEVGLVWTNLNFTYNGNAQKPTATATDVVSKDTVTVTVTGGQTNAGTYTASATKLSDNNYKLPSNTTQTFTIDKKTVTVTSPVAKELTYTGSSQALVNAGSVSDTNGAEIQYSLDNKDFSTTVPSKTNAGSYTVYWKAVLNDITNYEFSGITSGSIATTIEKKTVTVTAPTKKDSIKDKFNNTSYLSLANAGNVKDESIVVGKIQYIGPFDSDYSDNIPSVTNKGIYTVQWKAVINDSYSNNYKLPDISSGEFASEIQKRLPGEFSISANEKVHFIDGALYWDGSSFKTENNQYDYRTYGGKTSVIGGRSTTTPSNNVGLFYWSKDKTNIYAESYNSSGASGTDVFALVNGEAKSGLDVLSYEEWNYLLNEREGTASKWGFATIETGKSSTTVNGFVLLPDSWTLPSGCVFDGGLYNTNNYNSTQWEAMERAGAVFLPSAGYRQSASPEAVGDEGYWWTSTPESSNSANLLFFNLTDPTYALGGLDIKNRSYGCGVRLVER